jgi:cyanate permease
MRWLILAGLWLCYMSFGVVVTSLAPLVPVIQTDLAMSHSAMGSILGAWQLVYIAAAVPCGILLDRLGGRWALTLGVGIIVVSAVGRVQADSYWALLAAVMLFGIGGPIVSSGAPKIVTGIFTGSQRGLAMGIYMTGPTLGGIASLTLTHSVLLPAFGGDWRSVMLLWSAVALMTAVAWFAIASVCGPRVAGFDQGPIASTAGRPSSRGVIAELFREPAVRLVLALAVGSFLINHGLNNWLPEMLRSGGLGIVEAGYWAALPMVVGIVGSLTIPRLATPERRFRILFALCAAAAIASSALTFSGDLVLTFALVLQGFVRASLMTILILTLVELPVVRERHAGTASGLFFSAAEIGGVLGPLGLGLMHDITGGFNAGLYAIAAIAAAMALGAVRLSGLAGPKAD